MSKVLDEVFKQILDFLPGWKTYITGVGLIGLGVYQISQGEVTTGIATVTTGFGLLAGRRAVDRLLEKK